jgi:acyl-CoA synthetase (AMP-forming)/AMP-acid ligase II
LRTEIDDQATSHVQRSSATEVVLMSNAAQHLKFEAVPAVEEGIAKRIFSLAHRRPANVLFLAGEESWNARRVASEALQLAHGMLAAGVKPGDRVAMQVANRPEAAVILLACLSVGALLAQLNPAYKPAELDAFLRKVRPSLYFCEARHYTAIADTAAAVVPIDRHFMVGDESEASGLPSWHTLQRDEGKALPVIDLHAPAVLVYTSGTTGAPKLVAHTQVSLAHIVERIESFGFGESSRMLSTLSPHSVTGLVVLLGCMTIGMSAVLLNGYDDDAVLDAAEKHRCTSVFLTPYMVSSLNQVQRARPRDISHLKLCMCGGDVCHPSISQDFAVVFGQTLKPAWGMTEGIGTLTAGQTLGTYALAPDSGVLVDEDGIEVEDGEEGELMIRGDNLFKGYWLGPGQIDAARRTGWFATGDIMRKNANGDLHYVARKKDLIVRGGINISPAEVEQTLVLHPAVAEAAVVGVQDVSLGQRVVGFVILNEAVAVDPRDILRWAATRLVDYKVPEWLLVIDEIPRNEMGKTIRPRLAERATLEMQRRSGV